MEKKDNLEISVPCFPSNYIPPPFHEFIYEPKLPLNRKKERLKTKLYEIFYNKQEANHENKVNSYYKTMLKKKTKIISPRQFIIFKDNSKVPLKMSAIPY